MTVLACNSPVAPVEHPNVVLVLVDTLRADAVGVYGSPRPTTPNLDALAARGMVWENAVSQAAWTVPSVASLFTGVDPLAHHCRHFVARERVEMDTISPLHETLAERFQAAGYTTGAFFKSTVLDASLGYAQGFDTFTFVDGPDQAWGRAAGELNAAALPWILEQERDQKPFFAYLHYTDPHAPYHPPESYSTRFDAEYIGSYTGAVVPIEQAVKAGSPPDPRDWQHLRALYDGEVAYWDSELGRLLTALDPVSARTILVVMSDHGEAFFEHRNFFHQDVYRENLHVPVILSGPGIPRGRLAGAVQLIDLAPTLAELAGLEPGKDWSGRSAVPAMNGGPATHEDVVYGEYEDLRVVVDPGGLELVVGEGADKLYDLRSDPLERTDLASSRPGDVARLHAALDARLDAARRLGERYPSVPSTELRVEQVERLHNLGYLE